MAMFPTPANPGRPQWNTTIPLPSSQRPTATEGRSLLGSNTPAPPLASTSYTLPRQAYGDTMAPLPETRQGTQPPPTSVEASPTLGEQPATVGAMLTGSGVGAAYMIENTNFDWGNVLAKRTTAWGKIQGIELVHEFLGDLNEGYRNFLPDSLKNAPSLPSYDNLLGLQNTVLSWDDVLQDKLITNAQNQLGSMASTLSNDAALLLSTPSMAVQGAGKWVYAGWLAPMYSLATGKGNLLSNGLGSLASVMFLSNVAKKTHAIHEDAKAEGQEGSELAVTTTVEGGKELGKASAVWLAGDIGANLGMRFMPLEIEQWGKFKSLPRRGAAIVGAVFVGAAMNWLMETLLPTRSRLNPLPNGDISDIGDVPDLSA